MPLRPTLTPTADVSAGYRLAIRWIRTAFALASVDGRYSGFAFRLDTRKASGAAIRLQLAEAVREERASGK